MEKYIDLDLTAYIWWALLILTIPLRWLAALCIAALFHEIGHIIMTFLLGGRITEGWVFSFGAWMQSSPLPNGGRILATLAGPAFSFMLLLFFRWFPRLSICGLIQGVINLLPLPWLDGGRILYIMKEMKGLSH